jgi:hypothetical protein
MEGAALQVSPAVAPAADIVTLYEGLANEGKDFVAKANEQVAALAKNEADIQAKLDAVNKEIEAKSQPSASKEDKNAAKALKKDAKALAKDLDKAKSATKQARKDMIAQMKTMQNRHATAMKDKYKDVESRIKAVP